MYFKYYFFALKVFTKHPLRFFTTLFYKILDRKEAFIEKIVDQKNFGK